MVRIGSLGWNYAEAEGEGVCVCMGGWRDVGQETRVQAANDKEKLGLLWGTGINLGL